MRLVSVNKEHDVGGREKLHPVSEVLCPDALQLHGDTTHTSQMHRKAAGFFILQEN